ncbi:putative enzyme [Vibrio coralliirubri]|uniref:sugar O-acetyltransferase n=1 Tax=Vibrio coralliirubri TaxID=1516159 RepID=UPI00062FB3A6|nr:sugar O-acetyltransferase [Vibrio coralliirubri]CDT53189.1 putative enzyme [Vibrio coralliirubri]CDU00948.1 putative enzyme [Vibrio coralliirubri]
MNEQKQRMMKGEWYWALEPELELERAAIKYKCHLLNQAFDSDIRERLTYEILESAFAHVESPFHCDYGYNIDVGDHFYANHGCTILDGNKVKIGNGCLLGPNVVLTTTGHPLDPVKRAEGYEKSLPITIGDNVWIGANVTVLGGVNIGDNVVIGAGSVVTKDLPSNTVCVGTPAQPQKEVQI